MTKFYWHKYRYLPYERLLARRELEILSGECPHEFMEGLEIEGIIPPDSALQTTYFSKVILNDGTNLIPLQAKLEASSNGAVQSKYLNTAKRQSTRYSSHGIHEYRGKFNPQIVRVIGNIIGIKRNDWLIDPFCGSGTTLLEAFHNGWNAIGIDRNPLAVEIANAKIAAMSLDDKQLDELCQIFSERLLTRLRNHQFKSSLSDKEIMMIGGAEWEKHLPNFTYLSSWFITDVLVQFSAIFQEIEELSSPQTKLIARVILSGLVREVSLQEPSDLRIRRRKEFPNTMNIIQPYVDTLINKIKMIKYAQQHLTRQNQFHRAFLGDIRLSDTVIQNHMTQLPDIKFDGAITSPPYATGLPYVDTDRLSLVLLGLISADEIQDTQKSLIGNREISTTELGKLLEDIDQNTANLPSETIMFCRLLQNAVGVNDGFRRRNVPAVIYKYFAEMALGFEKIHQLLKPTARYALVVGINKTTLGGKQFVIDTPRLLAEIAVSKGFKLDDLIELDTYQRYDIHSTNSIRSESLILLSVL